MKLRSSVGVVLVLASSLALVSCKSEKQLVLDTNSFVSQMGGEYSVAKSVSKQYGYAVLFNNSSRKYVAVSLAKWNSSMDAHAYLDAETQNGRVYYNLQSQGGGDYRDSKSGLIFEGEEVSAKDGQSAQGFVEKLNIKAAQDNLMDLGMSSDRASEVAPMLVALAKKSELSSEDANAVLEAVGNTSLDEIMAAQSNPLSQSALIEKAAEANKMSPESMKAALGQYLQ